MHILTNIKSNNYITVYKILLSINFPLKFWRQVYLEQEMDLYGGEIALHSMLALK